MARSGCIFGATGTFKTTAIAHLARYIAETTGKATLLLSADGGGWSPCEEEVLAKMIIPYRCDPNVIPLPIVRKISQGYWPVNPEEPDVAKLNFRRANWDKIGAIAVEGITSIGSMLMRHCADKNLKTGEEGTSKFYQSILVDDVMQNEVFTQNSKGHYGFVQNQLYSTVTNFVSLPVEYVLFTAHEKKYAEDGELQCGISAPGKAITPLIPTWIGDCIHAQDFKLAQKERVPDPAKPGETIEVETVGVTCRYYFRKHIDPATGAIFDAKPRVTHSKSLELNKVFPGGFFVPTEHHGFDLYLAAVDKLAQDAAQSDSLRDWRRKADEKLGRVAAARPVVEIAPGVTAVAGPMTKTISK
jgi:hypothetical protein